MGEDVVGNRTSVKVVKNKMAPPFKEVEFDILYGEGISKEGDLLDLAANQNVIEKSGTWYTYKDERIGQGRENARLWLKDHPADLKKMSDEVLKKVGILATPASPTAAPASGAVTAAGKPVTGAPLAATKAPAPAAQPEGRCGTDAGRRGSGNRCRAPAQRG